MNINAINTNFYYSNNNNLSFGTKLPKRRKDVYDKSGNFMNGDMWDTFEKSCKEYNRTSELQELLVKLYNNKQNNILALECTTTKLPAINRFGECTELGSPEDMNVYFTINGSTQDLHDFDEKIKNNQNSLPDNCYKCGSVFANNSSKDWHNKLINTKKPEQFSSKTVDKILEQLQKITKNLQEFSVDMYRE